MDDSAQCGRKYIHPDCNQIIWKIKVRVVQIGVVYSRAKQKHCRFGLIPKPAKVLRPSHRELTGMIRYVLGFQSLDNKCCGLRIIFTMAGVQAGQLVAGTILTETVFAWPGIGRFMYDSLISRDYNVVIGVFIVTSLIVILMNCLVAGDSGFVSRAPLRPIPAS
ncbi:Binding-protein-dependent transport system inner membrane component [Thalassovita litoralis]|uniref:Binding-protein-dependent transport system inner membrane component n=1 Tax=Thalassovita litoralis TaxID=1010611 RepID=A0A521FIH6_9RHOB|nr:Binding-protein-dependent transport system inner membrane component [Thalassovita litoralis]